MADIEELKKFAKTPKNTLKIDWSIIENRLGFTLHENVKEFYSRITCDERLGFACCMYLDPKDFVKPSGNDKFDSYLRRNGNTNDMDRFGNDVWYKLKLLNSDDFHNSYETIYKAFDNTYINTSNIGRRANIAYLVHRFYGIYIFINNDTGKYEWVLHNEEVKSLEDTPHGHIADDFNEFMNKLRKMWKTE